jgi:hypothetical protein
MQGGHLPDKGNIRTIRFLRPVPGSQAHGSIGLCVKKYGPGKDGIAKWSQMERQFTV